MAYFFLLKTWYWLLILDQARQFVNDYLKFSSIAMS